MILFLHRARVKIDLTELCSPLVFETKPAPTTQWAKPLDITTLAPLLFLKTWLKWPLHLAY
jgi:hypothetical protein